VAAATIAAALVLVPSRSLAGPTRAAAPGPIRAAFYYPWFPETWKVGGKLTHYSPTLGLYSSASRSVEDAHIADLTYAGMDAAISSWHGPGHYTDTRLAALLARTVALRSPLRWAVYDEHDVSASSSAIAADLAYIRDHLARSRAYLKVGGKFVVFVYNDRPGCGTAANWRAANAKIGNAAYIDLKIFPGYRTCPAQPASWHQYAPAEHLATADRWAVSVSPGFWRADEASPRLARDPSRFAADVRGMVASQARWQLVTTFNEWGEGTAVEPARQWSSPSGRGTYLDILHRLLRPQAGAPAAVAAKPKPKPRAKPKPARVTRPKPTPTPATGATVHGIVGNARVGATLSPSAARRRAWPQARYSWLTCSWTGGDCAPAGAGATYRIRSADLGRTIRLLATPRPGGEALGLGPTATVVPATQAPQILAVGDIACDPASSSFNNGVGTSRSCKQLAVSDLARRLRPTAVLTLGDTVYECGQPDGFARSFGPSFGRMKPIIHPAIGNHEYGNACHKDDPSPYFSYFGAAAGKNGWYSYDVGGWHFIALNSECHYGQGAYQVGGCDARSPQVAWLVRDLATHRPACTLAYWHEPRFSSGEHGDAQQMGYVWNLLARAHVDIVLSGHNHDYERFDPIGVTPEGQVQPALSPSGIREFVVGTGGRNYYPFAAPSLHGEPFRNDSAFGVLSLTLQPNGYTWSFHSIGSSTPLDQGTGTCH
jgi:hypothetical protein